MQESLKVAILFVIVNSESVLIKKLFFKLNVDLTIDIDYFY